MFLKVIRRAGLYLLVLVVLVCALFPIYWMVITSFKTNGEIYRVIPTFLPESFNLTSYRQLINETMFPTYLRNSLVVSTTVSVLAVGVSVLAACGIARFQFKGVHIISKSILYAYLMPRTVMYIPLYMVTAWLGLNNTLWGLILIYPTIVIPYATWILISYFKTIPKELEEAAYIDGASNMKTMMRVTLPLCKPGIITTMVFSFTLCWGDYLYALVIANSDMTKTIPLGLADMIIDDLFKWGQLSAAAIISSIPIVLIYTLASKYIVTGTTLGGVKQ